MNVLVTGGGRGIGRAIALSFAEPGSIVAIAARTRTELDDTARAIVNAICPGWVETDMAAQGMRNGANAMGVTLEEFRAPTS